VILRWATQRNIAVIPKSNNQERLAANLQCDTFNLTAAELKAISAMNLHLRVSLFNFLIFSGILISRFTS
jgi:D-xylose reductase